MYAAPTDTAASYSSGDVYYVYIWNKPSARVKVTLTSNGTLVGTGNAAFIWATATWDEIGNIPASDVVDYGDYFAIGTEEPSEVIEELIPPLREFLPTRDRKDSTEISTITKLLIGDFDDTELGDVVAWHDEHHTGEFHSYRIEIQHKQSGKNSNFDESRCKLYRGSQEIARKVLSIGNTETQQKEIG